MRISTKLIGLICVAALLSAGLFALLAIRNYQDIQRQRIISAGNFYVAPLRDLGEGFYRHQSALLRTRAGADAGNLAGVDEQIRKAMDQLTAANQTMQVTFGRDPDISALKPVVDRVLAAGRGDSNKTAIVQTHEAAFTALRELSFAAADTFGVYSDSEPDIVLAMITQFEVFTNLLIARASLVSRIHLYDMGRAENGADNVAVRAQIDGLREQIGTVMEVARRAVRNLTRAARADEADRGWVSYVSRFSALHDRMQRYSGFVNQALTETPSAPILAGEDEATLNAMLELWRDFATSLDEILSARLDASVQRFYIEAAVLIASMLVLFSTMGWIVRRVTRDITAAEAVTTRIAEGDLDVEIPGTGRPDEIGGLSRAVEVLRQNSIRQRQMQESEREMMERLTETGIKVAESVQAIRAASGEISQGSSDLATRTERQASALQETVATMTEISATVSMNAQNSEKSRQLAAEALGSAEDGGKAVSSVVTAMSAIENSSSKIGEIIQVMEEISFQTKLLALNAAVEAARAGESGKGFAVVAQEVRALADRSRQASQQIRDLIAISSREVGQGVKLSGEAGEALTSIIDTVRRVAEIAPEIAAGSREQARSITEINKALNDLDAATQQNAALVEESSAAAASLADQAGQLVAVVSSFRTGSDDPGAAPPPAEEAPEPETAPKPRKAARRPQKAAASNSDWDEEF